MDGVTFYITIGRYGGFHIENDKLIKRIVFGFVGVAVIFRDIEIIFKEQKRGE